MSREKRKRDHLLHAYEMGHNRSNGLDDIRFVHNSIPEGNIEQIDMSSKIGELLLSSPIFINAMTGGGGTKTVNINQQLADVAKETNVGMAVGSQMAALKDSSQEESYRIVRKVYPNGTLIANLGAEATVDQARKAVEMIEANALQIHVNVIQELVMPEGDRDFSGTLKRIEGLVTKVEVPLIIKEVGYGMSRETIESLVNVGVQIIDIGGYGGTNFSKIENKRRTRKLNIFNDWGITTASSLLEAQSVGNKCQIIASGGLQQSSDLAKCLALGAKAGGFAGRFLQLLMSEGPEALIQEIQDLKAEMRLIMLALGVSSIEELQQVPITISGETLNWSQQRGFPLHDFLKSRT
ncbi:type 2 isopentenyl-diphosphate Delta-isomerase [Alkalihalobacillus pseudalcaliphilus]|uniref:type 2 isopentenyl-diphosphate Delta-isomerase n=1 Tax=Alkalihalobacillus pseudalcaliphilus TaxID=79884 RepID=UPI00064DC023|nr:type 2 isopentenyl-diphosphate Delta-isomerase [Alkalihalobacillus pseudalcaliphilus]KMK76456.1 isopentenyl pyrophosphate isomerase [Alkalihalobacillus pseudalcaliphilus]